MTITSAIEPPAEVETFTFTLDEPMNALVKVVVDNSAPCLEIRPTVPGGDRECGSNALLEKNLELPEGRYFILVSAPSVFGFGYSLSLTLLPPTGDVCDLCPVP